MRVCVVITKLWIDSFDMVGEEVRPILQSGEATAPTPDDRTAYSHKVEHVIPRWNRNYPI